MHAEWNELLQPKKDVEWKKLRRIQPKKRLVVFVWRLKVKAKPGSVLTVATSTVPTFATIASSIFIKKGVTNAQYVAEIFIKEDIENTSWKKINKREKKTELIVIDRCKPH
jgi:hypothetical protein